MRGDFGRRCCGLLLAAAAALAVGGCAADATDPDPTDVAEAAATRAAVPTWFTSSGGVAVPTPDDPAPVLIGPQIPRPGTFSVPRPAPHGRPLQTSPPPATCGGYGTPRHIVPGAVAGIGSATLSWQADGRPEVTGYRVQAVSQELATGAQPAPRQQTVARPAGCGPVTVTMTGLIRGGVYVFWLEEAVTDPQTSVPRLVQVGTSSPVTVR